MTDHTPLEWHLHPGAQALIGLIAEARHQPQTRTYKNPISSHRSPEWVEERYYDCPEYEALAGIQQKAIEVAFRAAQAGDFAQWNSLRGQCLATLIETEIARRGQAVAA